MMYLIQGFKLFFNSGELGNKVYWGNKLWLKAIPDLEWGMSCSTMCSDVVGEFGEGE